MGEYSNIVQENGRVTKAVHNRVVDIHLPWVKSFCRFEDFRMFTSWNNVYTNAYFAYR